MKKRHLLAVLLILLAAGLIGSAVSASEPVEGRAGRAELRFLEGMIDHHQMALDMANDCLAKATAESVKTLCQNIITAQRREILMMRGWLLAWYGVDYEPVSMFHSGQQATPASAGMMQGGMMGMMSHMSGMMENMSGMMDMMMGMMGGQMGMGMMQGGGMGMMGDTPQPQMGSAMPDMPMAYALHTFSLMGTLTMGEFLESTADLPEATPLMDALNQLLTAEGSQPNIDLSTMGGMTQGQMMGMWAEMHNLTLKDMREMVGHLDDGEHATMMTLMQHHMEVMAGGASSGAAQSSDHQAHHPQGSAAQSNQSGTGEHAQHQAAGSAGASADPPMTMGMFAGLNALTGRDYEIAWLEAMIDHHDDALHMAERILENAPDGVGHDELRDLAAKIISDQTAEIEAMEALIAELSA